MTRACACCHYLARSTVTERLLIAVGHRPVDCRRVRRRTPQPARAPQRRRARTGRRCRPADAADLARRHTPPTDPAVLDAIYRRSGGLPFAVVELARAVAADGPPARRDARAHGTVRSGAGRADVRSGARLRLRHRRVHRNLTGLSDEDAYTMLDRRSARRILHRTEGGIRIPARLGARGRCSRRPAPTIGGPPICARRRRSNGWSRRRPGSGTTSSRAGRRSRERCRGS